MTRHERFFVGDNANFFLPLNGKYRECGYACIRALYDALNGPDTDYRNNLVRQNVIDIFTDALQDTPILDAEGDLDEGKASGADLAKMMLKRLQECGWVETFRDPSHMVTAYRLTWMGRRFAAALTQDDDEIRIDTQNTRSTLAHLKQFVDRQIHQRQLDTDALMMAVKSARGVIDDFTEAIEHTVTRRCKLITSLNDSADDAAERGLHVIEYMAGQLVEELSDRFMRDNIELFQQEILGLLEAMDQWSPEVKLEIEKRLRKRHPGLLVRVKKGHFAKASLFLWARHQIERYVTEASEVLLPELRQEVNSLVRRARMHFEYLGRLLYQEDNGDTLMSILKKLEQFGDNTIADVLAEAEPLGRSLNVGLINIDKVIPPDPPKRLEEVTTIAESRPLTEAEQRRMVLQRSINRLFYTSSDKVKSYLTKALADTQFVQIKELPVVDTEDLMCALLSLSCAGVHVRDPITNKPVFKIKPLGDRIVNECFEAENFEIQYIGG